MSDKPYFVHESSYIDEPVSIGEGTKIWHFCHIMPGAIIGEKCSLGQNVNMGGKAVLGNNVKVQSNVTIGDLCTLEDDVFCGPGVGFTNVVNPRSHVSRKNEYKATLIKKGASLGANCTIVCGITVNEYAFIGAGTVIIRDVPAYALMVGNPARQIAWMCNCGVKLLGKGPEFTCSACGRKYIEENKILREI